MAYNVWFEADDALYGALQQAADAKGQPLGAFVADAVRAAVGQAVTPPAAPEPEPVYEAPTN